MRRIPIDTTRISFVGTGKAAERAEYVELTDGSRKRSGNQAKDQETGLPIFVVDVLVDDDEADRAEVIGVKILSKYPPETAKWQPVRFINLTAMAYTDQRSGRVAFSFTADGIEGQVTTSKATAA